MSKEFIRKIKESSPVIAICYDFDKTLSPDDMQAQGFIQSVGYDIAGFWKESNALAQENDMDQNLAYMYKMLEEAHGTMVLNKEKLGEYGAQVTLFPGVEEWFDRINDYGKEKNVIIEHYIISSGLKEMIEGTKIAHFFEKIYASSYYFDKKGVAKWPAQAINYTNKTQFLFRIQKGILDINDPAVNESFNPEDIRIPFRNMIYIGDSDTDIPCMKLVNSYGGHSIGVYNSKSKDKTKVHKMLRENRIKYFTSADYKRGAELDVLVKAIIERTATNEVLESKFYKCKNESHKSDEKNINLDIIMELADSRSFTTTHMIIKKMQKIDKWSQYELKLLFEIADENSQVKYILKDLDLKSFYHGLLSIYEGKSKRAKNIEKLLSDE